jgi:hypothetical protein
MTPPTTAPATTAGVTTITDVSAGFVRYVDDIEVPSPGSWSVLRTSHVAIADSRPDHPVPTRIIDGSLAVAEHPEQSTIVLHLHGREPMTFVGGPTKVNADRRGMSRWSIAGTLQCGGLAEPMTLALSYHGVFRSRGHARAWFSGSGAVEASPRRNRWRRSSKPARRLVVVDLLFDASTAPASPSAAANAAA